MSHANFESKHFSLERLAEGVHAAIHKPGGGAFANAGIIDLGDSTLLVDAFDTQAAASDLRRAAETLFQCPVKTIVLTHPHSDHWIGASAFEASTVLLASETTRQVTLEWGAEIVKGFQNRAAWEEYLAGMEKQLQSEPDQRVRAGLEKSIVRTRYTLAEMEQFQPRYADQTFVDAVAFRGSQRQAELRSLGRGHSEDDAVLLLPQEKIAFIGDIGFFDTQPFLGFCDLDLYRQQLRFFQETDYKVLIPGHGPVGSKEHVALQLEYMDVMEELVGQVAQRGGSFEEAMKINLPATFDAWLMGGMGRFETNVRYLFARAGGEAPEIVET
jgi:glyoxylase-like metal-dependent hydrolase (beta-lactamase superfamily II)